MIDWQSRAAALYDGGFRPMPMMRTMAAGAAMDKATPVAPGESTVSVNLDVVFELGR